MTLITRKKVKMNANPSSPTTTWATMVVRRTRERPAFLSEGFVLNSPVPSPSPAAAQRMTARTLVMVARTSSWMPIMYQVSARQAATMLRCARQPGLQPTRG
jgi:hypothetical protein